MMNIQCVLRREKKVRMILNILKLVSWDPGRGISNIWREASFFSAT